MAAPWLTTKVPLSFSHLARSTLAETNEVYSFWHFGIVGSQCGHKFDGPKLEGAIRVQGMQAVHTTRDLLYKSRRPRAARQERTVRHLLALEVPVPIDLLGGEKVFAPRMWMTNQK